MDLRYEAYDVYDRESFTKFNITDNRNISMCLDICYLIIETFRYFLSPDDARRCGSIFHRIKSHTDTAPATALSFQGQRKSDANSLIEFRLSEEAHPTAVSQFCCAMNQKQGAPASDVIIETSISLEATPHFPLPSPLNEMTDALKY